MLGTDGNDGEHRVGRVSNGKLHRRVVRQEEVLNYMTSKIRVVEIRCEL